MSRNLSNVVCSFQVNWVVGLVECWVGGVLGWWSVGLVEWPQGGIITLLCSFITTCKAGQSGVGSAQLTYYNTLYNTIQDFTTLYKTLQHYTKLYSSIEFY